MIYQIIECAIQDEGWKKLTVKEAIENGQTHTDVSINKMNKEKTALAWPNWDAIAVGGTIEADFWRSPKGGSYLFAPKPRAQGTTARSGASGVKAAQERKGEMIEKSMDRKEIGIQVAAAMRDCTLITLRSLHDQPFPEYADFMAEFKIFKDWYLKEWTSTEQQIDQAF